MLGLLIAVSGLLCRWFYFQYIIFFYESVSIYFSVSLQRLLPDRFKLLPFHSHSSCKHISSLQVNMFWKGEGGREIKLTSLSALDLIKYGKTGNVKWLFLQWNCRVFQRKARAVFVFRPWLKLERKAADTEFMLTVQRLGKGNQTGFMSLVSSL